MTNNTPVQPISVPMLKFGKINDVCVQLYVIKIIQSKLTNRANLLD